MNLKKEDLKDFLNEKAEKYNRFEFIEHDPVSIPHLYSVKEDIEISGFLTATIAWGNRASILKNANHMMAFMGNSPYDFIMNHDDQDLGRMEGFVHRTFNSADFIYFIKALKYIYGTKHGLEGVFNKYQTEDSLQPAIHELKCMFFELPNLSRTTRHVSDPLNGSAAKKINMFLWIITVAINQNLLVHHDSSR